MENKHSSTHRSPTSNSELESLMERLQDLSHTVSELQEVILNLSEKALTELAVDTENKTENMLSPSALKQATLNQTRTEKPSVQNYQDVLTAEEIAMLIPQRILH